MTKEKASVKAADGKGAWHPRIKHAGRVFSGIVFSGGFALLDGKSGSATLTRDFEVLDGPR